MFETKVIVAPNSPMLRAKERIMPAVDRLDRQADRAHHQRKAHHRAGECRTGPAKGEHDPEMLVEELAERAAAAEQQQVTGHHRRPAAGEPPRRATLFPRT